MTAEASAPIDLDHLVALHEPLLRDTLNRRRSDEDIPLLGDLRSPGFGRAAREHLGDPAVDGLIASASSSDRSPWMVLGKSPDFVANLRRSGGFANRSIAGQMEAVRRAGNGTVPLVVISTDRTIPTAWSPPGCKVVLRRVKAPATPESS
jgi:hypothetical protein